VPHKYVFFADAGASAAAGRNDIFHASIMSRSLLGLPSKATTKVPLLVFYFYDFYGKNGNLSKAAEHKLNELFMKFLITISLPPFTFPEVMHPAQRKLPPSRIIVAERRLPGLAKTKSRRPRQ